MMLAFGVVIRAGAVTAIGSSYLFAKNKMRGARP